MQKKIIHVDMDCFYAQVEMRDRPELKNVPLAIGGAPGTRSVLCTSNYIARTFGVKSAMPTDFAVRLCPKLVVLPPNFKKYQKASEIIQNIFLKYSDMVETVSLDEAYLDVTGAVNATEIGKLIKEDIWKATGLTASVGIAPNKFLAKIASDWKKPNGLFVIKPHEVESFVKDLPVKLIPGVGKVGLQHLESLGIKTCNDIRSFPPEVLALSFGKFSLDLFYYSRGIDEREVQSEWERKSLSVENTFLNDMTNPEEMKLYLEELLMEMKDRVGRHLEDEPHKKIKKIFVKVKYNDFKQSTSEETLIPFEYSEKIFDKAVNIDSFYRLLNVSLAKKTRPVRLLGVGVRFLTGEEVDPIQLSFLPLCA
ncbi:MAG: DNA polymerase IV [Rhizobacter sp.]|nr:DNA polymerase IV [Bacteriovorax sp.]